jgi:hypothetical protein
MADPQTPNIGLNVPTTGSDTGTWGLSLNANFDAIDSAFGGSTTIPIVGGTVTLIATQLPFATIQFTGILTSNATIVVPAYSGELTFVNNCTGAFTVTVELNGQPNTVNLPIGEYVRVFFSAIGPISTFFPAGTVMIFAQAAAPVGWTQITTVNDAALRIVSGGTGGSITGTVGLSAFIAAGANPTALTTAQLAAHSHGVTDPTHSHIATVGGASAGAQPGGITVPLINPEITSFSATGVTIQNTGSGATHAHGFPALQYYDSLIASKN